MTTTEETTMEEVGHIMAPQQVEDLTMVPIAVTLNLPDLILVGVVIHQHSNREFRDEHQDLVPGTVVPVVVLVEEVTVNKNNTQKRYSLCSF